LGHGATQGETIDEALAMGQDLLVSILNEQIKRGDPLPSARKAA